MAPWPTYWRASAFDHVWLADRRTGRDAGRDCRAHPQEQKFFGYFFSKK
jgi:hypothetical protein